MQVEAAGRFEDAVDFQQTDGHIAEIGGHAFGMSAPGYGDEVGNGLVGCAQVDEPFLVDVGFPAPKILVRGFRPVDARLAGVGRAVDAPAFEQTEFVVTLGLGKRRLERVFGAR